MSSNFEGGQVDTQPSTELNMKTHASYMAIRILHILHHIEHVGLVVQSYTSLSV